MKTFKFFLFLIFLSLHTKAQHLVNQWVKVLNPFTQYSQIIKDDEGNVLCFGSGIVKYGRDGRKKWDISESPGLSFTGMVSDQENNLYVIGNFHNEIDFKGTKLKSRGDSDIFIAKLSISGELIWLKQVGGPGNDNCGGITFSRDSSIIIIGTVKNDPKFGDSIIPLDSLCRPFIVRYDLNGNLKDVKYWNTIFNDHYSGHLSLMRCLSPVVSGGDLYFIWDLFRIKVVINNNDTLSNTSVSGHSFYLLKYTNAFVTKLELGSLPTYESFFKIGIEDKHQKIYTLKKEFPGGKQRTILYQTNFDLSGLMIQFPNTYSTLQECVDNSEAYNDIAFDNNGNILLCGFTKCSARDSTKESNFLILAQNEINERIYYKNYKLTSSRVDDEGITSDTTGKSIYILANTDNGIQIGTNQIPPGSVFLAKFIDSLNYHCPGAVVKPFPQICLNSPSIELSGGFPSGGVFSGPGILNGLFMPAQAGIGTHIITYTYIDSSGCKSTTQAEIKVENCTGVNQLSAVSSSFSVYPNPSEGIVTLVSNLTATCSASITIKDLVGQRIFFDQAVFEKNEHINIDLKNISKGVYLLEVRNGNSLFEQKIIIQ